MIPDVLERTLREDMRELNLDFLDLVRRAPPGAAYGLPGSVHRGLALLPASAVARLARTPCLLACLADEPMAQSGDRVADAPAAITGGDQDTAIFATALLTWLWQVNRQAPVLAALYAGCAGEPAGWLSRLDFGQVRRRAGQAAALLRVRFAHHPRCWPDLVDAALHPDREMLRVARMSLVQLGLACAPPPGRARAHPDRSPVTP